MGAWGKDQKTERQGADARRRQRRPSPRQLGLEMDGSGFGLGMRSKRYAMVVENGVVKSAQRRRARRLRGLERRGDAQGALSRPHARSAGPEDRRARSAIPARASASARSFSGWPAWPRTQMPLDSMRRQRGLEPLPQIDILHRLLVGGLPAARLPLLDPARDAVLHILAVGMEPNLARAASAPPARRSPPSAPCGCWWWGWPPPELVLDGRHSAAARPSRPAPDCRCRRRR